MKTTRIRQAATAAAVCASVAAMVGIATTAAAPSHKNGNRTRRAAPPIGFAAPLGPPPAGAPRKGAHVVFGGPAMLGGPPVHSEMVVPNKDGDGFITITQDNGKVSSVSGSQLTIIEGTEDATYKTVTLDIPSDAKVIRDGRKVELGDLQEGDQVHVSQSSEGSFVFATDRDFQKRMMKQFREHMKDLPRPRKGFQGGPPPGPPPLPMSGQRRY